MKFVLTGILVGAFAVTVGIVVAEQIRRQRKIENVADLTDRLARQLEFLERDLEVARETSLPKRVVASNGVTKRKSPRTPRPRQA